jgi:glyoxylase-like metal-dependent hydrolase (beta-lactamase superfamily II)
MNSSHPEQHGSHARLKSALVFASAASALALVGYTAAASQPQVAPPGSPGTPYQGMPAIAPIGTRVDRYLPVPKEAKGPPINPRKGYRIEELGRGLYMVSDNFYQSMFMVYEQGVVVIDAPPNYSAKLRQAIGEVTQLPVTHLIYSHSHSDHIGGATDLNARPVVIAQEDAKWLLQRVNDPKRPIPTVTFKNSYTLKLGSQTLELKYPAGGHERGNIFIYAPEQRVLMVVDVVFPGWMPWRRFALATDVPALFEQVEQIDAHPFRTFVGGHVTRVGSHADVRLQLDFMNDLKAAAAAALKSTKPRVEMHAADFSNPWAIADNYIDRVVARCVAELTPRWQSRLAGFDVYIWDQCYAMEQSLRIE